MNTILFNHLDTVDKLIDKLNDAAVQKSLLLIHIYWTGCPACSPDAPLTNGIHKLREKYDFMEGEISPGGNPGLLIINILKLLATGSFVRWFSASLNSLEDTAKLKATLFRRGIVPISPSSSSSIAAFLIQNTCFHGQTRIYRWRPWNQR